MRRIVDNDPERFTPGGAYFDTIGEKGQLLLLQVAAGQQVR